MDRITQKPIILNILGYIVRIFGKDIDYKKREGSNELYMCRSFKNSKEAE